MHSSSLDTTSDLKHQDGGDVLVGIAALVTEGRTTSSKKLAAATNKATQSFLDGPHCSLSNPQYHHTCDSNDHLCINFENVKEKILNLWHRNIPVCVEVVLTCSCKDNPTSADVTSPEDQEDFQEGLLLEQWYITISRKRAFETQTPIINVFQLVNAIRSQLHFSQISAWLTKQDDKSTFQLTNHNIKYRLTVPGETVEGSEFSAIAVRHDFPVADIGNGFIVNVTFFSLPRLPAFPTISCSQCSKEATKTSEEVAQQFLDDRMHVRCSLKGKHCCEESEEDIDAPGKLKNMKNNKRCNSCKNPSKSTRCSSCEPSTSTGRSAKTKPKPNCERMNYYSASLFNYQRQKGFTNGSYYNRYTEDECSCRNSEQNKMRGSKQDHCEDISDLPYNDSDSHYEKLYGDSLVGCHRNSVSSKSKSKTKPNKSQLLLDAIERTARKCANSHCSNVSNNGTCDADCVDEQSRCACASDCDVTASCDNRDSDILSIRRNQFNIYEDGDHCDRSRIFNMGQKKLRDVSNVQKYKPSQKKRVRLGPVQRLTFDDEGDKDNDECCDPKLLPFQDCIKEHTGMKIEIPSPSEQAKFRKSLDSAASMVFHSQTGLPLTSSPAPVRRGKSCFDFDSSINSVSAIKSALYSTSFSTDEESESESSTVSPCSPDSYTVPKRDLSPIRYKRKGHAASLLGSFEESVLNGRLEPVSTVHGFTAELGASGSFVPKHLVCPVTVFFYTLGDNDKVSSPYLGHINLGKKGYNVPKCGTVQVTLFNPLRTVVKMFVIMYDLSDMPPNSQTFIRQRTLYMPTSCKDENLEWGPKWLRYLIHLRFMSSKSGKVYLHSDIRMIIFRKSDMDTATAHGIDMSYELRSFTHMPTNPKFSPRK